MAYGMVNAPGPSYLEFDELKYRLDMYDKVYGLSYTDLKYEDNNYSKSIDGNRITLEHFDTYYDGSMAYLRIEIEDPKNFNMIHCIIVADDGTEYQRTVEIQELDTGKPWFEIPIMSYKGQYFTGYVYLHPTTYTPLYMTYNAPKLPESLNYGHYPLWFTNGSIRYYSSGSWHDLIPKDTDQLSIQTNVTEIPEWMYHVEHDANTYTIRFNYQYEEGLPYSSSAAQIGLYIDNFDTTKPIHFQIRAELADDDPGFKKSLFLSYEDGNYENEGYIDPTNSGDLYGTVTLTGENWIGGSIGFLAGDDIGRYPSFRGHMKIWQD